MLPSNPRIRRSHSEECPWSQRVVEADSLKEVALFSLCLYTYTELAGVGRAGGYTLIPHARGAVKVDVTQI